MFKNVMALGAGAVVSVLLVLPGATTASAASAPSLSASHGGPTDPNAAVVNVENGPYGPVLVVGGAGAGYKPATAKKPAHYLFPAGSSLYFPTIDPSTYGSSPFRPYQPGCTTTVVDTGEGPLSCAGGRPIGRPTGPPSRPTPTRWPGRA